MEDPEVPGVEISRLLENVLQRQFPGLKAEVGMNNEISIEGSRKWENWQWYRKKMTESATILHLRYLKNMQNRYLRLFHFHYPKKIDD